MLVKVVVTKYLTRSYARGLKLHHTQKKLASAKTKETPSWRKQMYNIDGSLKDYYEILGIQPNASQQEIQRAYYDLNKLLHPDTRLKSHSTVDEKQALYKLNEAHESYYVLRSRSRRVEYDSERKRIKALEVLPDVDEVIGDINQWISKQDKNAIHDKIRMAQFNQFGNRMHRYQQENTDPNTFIQMGHRKTMFNRKLAQEKEIANKESMQQRVRRQNTLDYTKWKQKMEKKNNAFGQRQSIKLNNDPILNEKLRQLHDINEGNKQFYQKNMHISMTDDDEDYYEAQENTIKYGPTPNAYWSEINPRRPFGGDEKWNLEHLEKEINTEKAETEKSTSSSASSTTFNPQNMYDGNIKVGVDGMKQKVSLKRTIDLSTGNRMKHDDIKGTYSSNQAIYEKMDEDRKKIWKEWRLQQEENKYRYKPEPLQIAGKVDNSANAKEYSWYEKIGSDYKPEYGDYAGSGYGQTKQYAAMKGVGPMSSTNHSNIFNFDLNANIPGINDQYNGQQNMNSSSAATNVIFGHLGIICGVFFIFVATRSAKNQ